jgi:Secretion system C-terminal sorting domain/PA domain
MKKYIILFVLGTILTSSLAAQSQKRDTVVLSLYNNNQRYMLYPMPFGKDKPDNDFVAEMAFAIDTIHVLKDDIKRDSSGKFPKKWLMERSCGKVPTNVKGKVALLNINAACDISTQVYNAQEAGALAVIVIHTTNNKDSVTLPKKSNTIKYDNDNKVKIPCFTVRKEIGMTLLQMSPSLVGIKRPKDTLGTIQALQAANNESLSSVQLNPAKSNLDSLAKTKYEKGLTEQQFHGIGWAVSPNPARDEAVLQYNFTQVSTLNIEIFNETGQVLTNYKLENTQTGKLQIDVTAWQSGVYSVSLVSGSMREVKRLVVAH